MKASACLLSVFVCLICIQTSSEADITPLTDRPVVSFKATNNQSYGVINSFRNEQNLLIGIEQWTPAPEATGHIERPAYSVNFQNMTVGSVLDELVRRDGRFSLKIDGEWINFVPKSIADDPDYWLNRHVDGKVTVSAAHMATEPSDAYTAAMSDVSVGCMMNTLLSSDQMARLKWMLEGQKGPMPKLTDVPEDKLPRLLEGSVILDHPTIRDVFNARAYFLGTCGWTISTYLKDPAKSHGVKYWANMTYSEPCAHANPYTTSPN